MSKHIATIEQEKAFKQAVSALRKCKKLGLRVYAKNSDLVAYTKEADDYAEEKCPMFKMDELHRISTIPYLSGNRIVCDSGSDDYAFYITQEDADKYNPDDL